MKECTRIRRLLALPRADWSSEERHEVETHLADCEQCTAVAQAYAEQDRLSRAMPPVALAPSQRDHVLARAAASGRRPAHSRVSAFAVSAAALAVIAFLALGLAALFRQGIGPGGLLGPGEGTSPASTPAPGEQSPLAGTEWVLTSLNGEALLEGSHITLNFQEDQLGGFAGCNTYGGGPDSGGYSATEEGSLTIPQVAMTMMACSQPQGVMEQEQAYLQALHSTATYRLVDDGLELADASGKTVLVYTRQPEFQGNPADLLGTAWRLVSLNGSSPLDGSDITLTFQDSQNAGGHAGCRDYAATYQATGGDLSVLSTTMIGDVCSDEALLEQEENYTTILGWTRHYQLSDGQLALLSARGEVLTFEALAGAVPSPAPTVASPSPGSDLGKLAWIQDGDVWIRVLPDGGPVQLTEDSRASEPRWSPSGEWLAYRQDTAVWLIRADGQDGYALDGGGVIDTFAWSPVADELAYVAGSGTLRLEVLHAGETEPVMLLPAGADGQPGRIAWSPDGTWIAYELRRGAADYEGLWKIVAGGGEPVELYDSGIPQRGEALLAGWTPDGNYLLFWQGEMLSASLLADGASFYSLPVSGGQPVLLAGGSDVVLYHDDFWRTLPGWPYVAFTVGGGRETWTNKRIAVADPATGQLFSLTDDTVAAFSPAVSPGAAQIAYVAGPDAGPVGGGQEGRAAVFQRHIWVLGDQALSSSYGPLQRQLTDDPAYRDERPLWSADSSHILFVRMDQQEQVSLWLLPGQEQEPQEVAAGLGPLAGPDTGWFGYYGYIDWDTLFDWWQAPIETTAPPNSTPAPTATPVSVNPGVAALLGNPPAPGESVELDAYFSGAGAAIMPGGPPPQPDQVFCPTNLGWASALTDRPFLASLQLLNGVRGNGLPDGAAWLVATTPEATQPGRRIEPQLPYLGRLRGHLGDPAFSQCPNADRIFVVEEVLATYQEQPPAVDGQAWAPPAGYAAWPRYEDAALGYGLPYPPDWEAAQIEQPGVVSAVALRSPQWPGYALVVRVHTGESRYDQYDPASLPPLMQGTGWGVYEQGWAFGQPVAGSQGLSGYTVDRPAAVGQGEEAVLFSGGGYTYELDLTYPTGFDASQALLTAYTAMVEGFRLASAPGPTPTPPVKDTLGPGPFLTEEEALARVQQRDGQDVELWDAALVSEASARQMADACNTFFGHPDGVWLLTVHGTYEGTTRTLHLFLDATTGEQLCGEEIAPPGQGDGLARLRVTNDSPYDLERVVVVFPGERVAFGPLAPGETSDYHSVRGGVYAYAAYNVALNGQTINQPVIDWVGDQPLQGDMFTYILSVDPERPSGQQIQGQVHQDQSSSLPVAGSPGGQQLATLAGGFSLAQGTRWVYSYVPYEPLPSDPWQIITATYLLTETVVETEVQPPYFAARIQRDVALVSAVPLTQTNLPVGDFWYVISGTLVFAPGEPADLSAFDPDSGGLAYSLPLAVGQQWCPIRLDPKNPVDPTDVHCEYNGMKTVQEQGPYETPAGKFDDCYTISEAYNSGGVTQWLCTGVGVVAARYDHAGTRFGFDQELIRYSPGSP